MDSEYKICNEYGGKMFPSAINKTLLIEGKDVKIKGINVYICEKCENIVYAPKEAEKLESLIQKVRDFIYENK